jgi:hypothetical protein
MVAAWSFAFKRYATCDGIMPAQVGASLLSRVLKQLQSEQQEGAENSGDNGTGSVLYGLTSPDDAAVLR